VATSGSGPLGLVQIGSMTFFLASTPQTGSELWKSDGTVGGTVLVKDIRPGPDGSFPVFSVPRLAGVSGTLFFTASDGVTGSELWKSDGTEAGTVRVKGSCRVPTAPAQSRSST
jgi:ELWxxDGT repeat protein